MLLWDWEGVFTLTPNSCGAGTELYRGVGAIVLFGVLGTAIVSLTFLPALSVMALSWQRTGGRKTGDGGRDQQTLLDYSATKAVDIRKTGTD